MRSKLFVGCSAVVLGTQLYAVDVDIAFTSTLKGELTQVEILPANENWYKEELTLTNSPLIALSPREGTSTIGLDMLTLNGGLVTWKGNRLHTVDGDLRTETDFSVGATYGKASADHRVLLGGVALSYNRETQYGDNDRSYNCRAFGPDLRGAFVSNGFGLNLRATPLFGSCSAKVIDAKEESEVVEVDLVGVKTRATLLFRVFKTLTAQADVEYDLLSVQGKNITGSAFDKKSFQGDRLKLRAGLGLDL